ncbi:hypothetical protein [Bombiscardovia apis]|uniref:hypothetical protein n=1 Tax=Bombiscardovia apis TaxID=2932182 RepID=UPI002953E347|nr:hypothetical protein [Bombiscardovia apis]
MDSTNEIVVGVLVLIIFCAVLILLLRLWIKFLARMRNRSIQKKIAAGKIKDKTLMKLYQRFQKSQNGKVIAMMCFGVNYKLFLRTQSDTYEIYKAEMIRRNLPL